MHTFGRKENTINVTYDSKKFDAFYSKLKHHNVSVNVIKPFSNTMAAFQNVSIHSLHAVLLLYINYVDVQSNQIMHQL